MKRIVNILALIFLFSAIFTLMVGCETDEEKDPVYQDYTITIVDGLGNPIRDVIVKIHTPGGEVKNRVTNKEGIASLKNVIAGDYRIIIEQGASNAVIKRFEYALTEDVTNLKLVLRDSTKTIDIYGDIPDESFAYNIDAGTYDIPCEPGQMAYFVFNPNASGVYKISVSSTDEELTVGHYGIPMFVQSHHISEGEYDGKSFEIIIQDADTPYVFGLKSTKFVNAKFTVERTGDAPFDPEFAPWTIVPSTADITKCDLPEGAKLKDINVTDSSVSVTLGDDGYYYTSDGKLVYIRIGSVCDAKYLDVSIAYIAGLVDANFGQNFGGYVYDENGEFVNKYSYNTMLESYYGRIDENGVIQNGNCDETGVYPLTAELAEAIKCHGNSVGWWKPNTPNYLFNGVPVNLDIAWLFLCCTIE